MSNRNKSTTVIYPRYVTETFHIEQDEQGLSVHTLKAAVVDLTTAEWLALISWVTGRLAAMKEAKGVTPTGREA